MLTKTNLFDINYRKMKRVHPVFSTKHKSNLLKVLRSNVNKCRTFVYYTVIKVIPNRYICMYAY